ncbi:hypothetical protein K3495_g4137 [Podosphaera aphanis]|nr:hypothetical protein K3495_g4137 [Podosphaera aphanis]
MKSWAYKNNRELEPTFGYHPEANDIAERANRTIMEKGHLYTECRKLKASQQKKKEKKAANAAQASKFHDDSDSIRNFHNTSFMAVKIPSPTSQDWIFDTGASAHMTRCRHDFKNFKYLNGRTVKIANNAQIPVTRTGTVRLKLLNRQGKIIWTVLYDVLFVPSFGKTRLFSWEAIRKKGFKLLGEGNDLCIIDKNGEEVLWAKAGEQARIVQVKKYEANFSSYTEFHEALGHPGVTTMKNSPKLYSSCADLPSPPPNFHCPTREKSKSIHKKPNQTLYNTTRPFELIHTDLSGKFSVPSLSGKYYYITFIDEHTRYAWVKFLRNKSEASQHMIDFVKYVKTQFKTNIKRWRTDNGREFVNESVHKLFRENGIVHEKSPPYEHERNGNAERFNQTLTTMARSLIMNHGLSLWAEPIATACYLKNRLPHTRLPENVTPSEVLLGTKPTIHHIKSFGRNCYVHIHKDSRPSRSKLQPRAIDGKFVGYTNSTKIFRIWIPSKNIVIVLEFKALATLIESPSVKLAPLNSREVTIDLKNPSYTPEKVDDAVHDYGNPLIQLEPQPSPSEIVVVMSLRRGIVLGVILDNYSREQQENSQEINDEDSTLNDTLELSQTPELIKRYGSPVRHGPSIRTREEHDNDISNLENAEKFQERVRQNAVSLAAQTVLENNEEPITINETFSAPDQNYWRDAVEAELKSLTQNNTWDEVDRPRNRNIVGSKWVFKVKRKANGSIERYEARLVAQGFSQLPGHDFDETFAPVARYDSLRILRIASQYKWIPRQMDVNSAYLYGTLKEEIYMELPPGFRTSGKRV